MGHFSSYKQRPGHQALGLSACARLLFFFNNDRACNFALIEFGVREREQQHLELNEHANGWLWLVMVWLVIVNHNWLWLVVAYNGL